MLVSEKTVTVFSSFFTKSLDKSPYLDYYGKYITKDIIIKR